ncbi:histone-like nucleoid-structuring protein Lsr2 [Haematomicrobium sanguinis]|uniref:histone-like nucleoid-structuring protein Lsr2 n=1 Tax=Haematomicrobium sanguinis TaxID=479106 RepID=UPI00047C9C35|nr:Lsr2 family protein [Haematomicrobium sanguinis]
MAQKINVVLVDDFNGGDADETVQFGLAGNQYEIDLSTANADKFRKLLEPYVEVARKVSSRVGRPRTPGSAAAAQRNRETAIIREWAKENGYPVNERGRIRADIIEAYRKAKSNNA